MSWFLIRWKMTGHDFRKIPFLTSTRRMETYYPKHKPKPLKWMLLTLFGAIPLLIAAHANLILQKGGIPEKRREKFIPYEHLRIRKKR